MSQTILHFGGNGHCVARMESARAALSRRGIRLVDVPYPGFEGRPKVDSVDQFLGNLWETSLVESDKARPIAIATGIGGLIALSLRSEGVLPGRLILQAPVLWGLEQRIFPKLMRWQAFRSLIRLVFRNRAFQKRFARKQFRNPPDSEFLARFFEGYEQCAAFEDLFRWFSPAFLRILEVRFAGRTDLKRDIEVWWGAHDAVLSLDELKATERALGVRWPVKTFPNWGHYPMIDEPEEWALALADAVERPEPVPELENPQAR